MTFSPRNTSRGSKHDNKLQGGRSQARFVTQILPGHRLSQVVTEVHLYLIKFNNLSFKMMKSINLSALNSGFTFSQRLAGPDRLLSCDVEEAAVSIFALGVRFAHSFCPNSTGLLLPLSPKLRFTQSSGTNECRVNLSRHQRGSEKCALSLSDLCRYCF